jgi:type VI secretion system protein ImpK
MIKESSLAPSLFDSGEIGTGANSTVQLKPVQKSLLDFLYEGFYLVFLLKNGYVPQSASQLQTQLNGFLDNFENQARRNNFTAENIYDVKYAFCALVDETIMVQQSSNMQDIKAKWEVSPLQLSLFGSQLAGEKFFSILENLRAQGLDRLPALEVFHYCLLLGFQGKYRLEAPEKINYLIARLSDEIDYLKGKKKEFSPFWAIPDQIRHVIRNEIPVGLILVLLSIFALIAFSGIHYVLAQNREKNMAPFSQMISAPQQQAHLTIYLP